jgi:alpha-L-fucosidase
VATPEEDKKAMTRSVYVATRESLNSHPVPQWYEDAKFGVFIHWGLFSVPGFAPRGSLADVIRTNYDRAMLLNPYAEQYWNAIKDPTTPSAAFHRAHYGDMPYQGFKELFAKGLEQWDPAGWARTFHDAGARYVVLVAKHHDGFCLWPTAVANPHEADWFSERTAPAIPHSDFRTPEYTRYADIQAKKWEMTRGIGNSFGYNRNEQEEDYASFETLLPGFVDAVSKNGNLLLNVGPRGEDARIPQEQSSRLHRFGEWLRENGEAVYGTRPWSRAEAVTEEGTPVRFTQKGSTVNVIVLGAPDGDRLKIRGVSMAGKATLHSDGSPVDLTSEGANLVLAFKTPLKGGNAPVIAVA